MSFVYVYVLNYGLCLCWVGASLPGWSIHQQSWEGSPNGIKSFIISCTGEAGDGEAPQKQEGVPLKWSGTSQGILAFLRTPFD